MNCPVCRSGKTSVVLEQKGVPVHQNLVCETREEALNVTRGDITLMLCECGFVFNGSFDESLLSYGARYNNNQMASPAFTNYVDSIVDHLNPVGKTVVEIGCGHGDFLLRLCARGNKGIGFDPSYIGPTEQDRVRFVREYFDGTPADFTVCRHVIEHTPDPLGLIRSVDSPEVFFETPNLDWILENRTWWDIFYEHCNYFTPETLGLVFSIAGYEGKVSGAFGGQYLWYEGHLGSGCEGRDLPQSD